MIKAVCSVTDCERHLDQPRTTSKALDDVLLLQQVKHWMMYYYHYLVLHCRHLTKAVAIGVGSGLSCPLHIVPSGPNAA